MLRVHVVHSAIPAKRALTPALLRRPKTAADLERVTGASRLAIRHRRKALGIGRNERTKERSWLPAARAQNSSVPDTEIARSDGVRAATVAVVRAKLGIPRAVAKSRATSDSRDRMRKLTKRDLAKLEPIDARIIAARYLRPRPETLAQIGVKLGMSRQRIAQLERRTVARLTANGS